MQDTEVSAETATLSERQLCLLDIAHLRKQCERASPFESAEDKLACPIRREMHRLLDIVVKM